MNTSRSSSTAKSVAHRQKGVLAGTERRTSSSVSQQQQTQQQLQQPQPRFEQPPEPLASQPSTQEAEETGKIVRYLDLAQKASIKPYVAHKCTSDCLHTLKNPDDPSAGVLSESPFDYKGLNPLEIPIRAGWLRCYLRATPPAAGRDCVIYITPCGRRLRSPFELEHFLHNTGSQLTPDLFCFDKAIVINQEFRCHRTFIKIADLSYGKENVPVPCVNCVDNETPTYVEYIAQRQPVGNVHINTDSDFLVCCDCTDNCRDRSKCACQQLTIEASSFTSARGLVDFSIGYRHRRLSQFTMGGIYECNKNCKCDRRCRNRVVQQGVWVRLQVFKTNRKGWGIRALNAIPKGSFICTYAGAIYDDNMAIDEGYGFGDEYQAELDYIETIEKPKEDFEPYAIEPSDSFDEYECASPASLPTSSNTSRRNGGRRRRRRRRKSSSSSSSVSSSSRSSSLSIASSCVSCASSSCASFATSSIATNSEVIELDPVRSSSPGVDLDAAGAVEPSAGGKPSAGLRVASKLVRKAEPVKPPRVNDLSTPTGEAAPPNAAQEDLAPCPNLVQKADPLKPSQENDPPTPMEGADPPNDTQEVRLPSPNLVQMTDSVKVLQENDPTKPINETDHPSAAQETHSPSPNFVQMADSLKDFQQNASPTPIETDSPKAAQEIHSPSPNHVQMADSLDVFQENDPLTPIKEADCPNTVQDIPSPNPNVAQQADPSKLSLENDTVTLVEEVDPPNIVQETTLPDPIPIQEATALNPSQENDPTTPSDVAVPPDAAQEARSSNSVQESDSMLLDQESDTANFVQQDPSPKPLLQVAETAAEPTEVPLTACVTPISDSNASSIHPDSPISESRASTAEEDVESVEHDIADLAPPSPPEMTRMETSPSSSSSPSVATLLENQLAELEPTISGLLANSRLLVPAFSTTAPGLSDCTGISNLREVLAEAAFNRLPFVRLSPLLDPVPVGGDSDNRHTRRKSLRSSNTAPKPPSVRPPVIVQPATPSKTRETRSSLGIARKPTTVDHTQPRILLRINLRKNASAVLGRSSSTSSLLSLNTKSVDNEGRSSLSSGSRRAPSESRGGSRRSTSSRRANERPSRERQGHHDHGHHRHHHHHHHHHQHHSRNYIASASSSPAPPPTWANRRAYPIARKDWLLARNYFGDESPYVMDAKKMGNLGRYFNHSCNPNVFVQNVFIDTHDPRFPEVAFFAKRNIAAGEEMTWDYGYVVDAVPFKVLYCYCGEPSCRIRLL
ncbi:Histone-lysine N-methyltransferase [Sparganum proliferum]